jgi:O-succinylbenzoic acid--CoA ligase
MVPWLLRAAAMHPDRPAVNELTYAELETRARGAAGALRELGVGSGERVALALPAGVDLAVALHGSLLAGAVAVPIDLRLTPAERESRMAGAKAVVEEPLEGPAISDVAELDLESIATVMHTSGTTAAPKPVPLTFGNWLASALGSAVALGLDPHERWLCPLPLSHVGGLSIPIRSVIYGTSALIHERFDPDAVLDALRERVTLISLVPTMLSRLLDNGLSDPPSLRLALLGGGPIPAPLLERAAAAGVPVAPTYGMTEACSQIVTRGWPLPGVSVRIGADGEVLVRGATVSPACVDDDGWLHTGDLGSLDERGRLGLTGRATETIVSGGENVAPVEVEAVLLEHPAVADVAVHGRPDSEWGEAVVATVVPRNGVRLEPDELRAFCARRLAPFKVPKEVDFADRLPRSQTGKLLRRELR